MDEKETIKYNYNEPGKAKSSEWPEFRLQFDPVHRYEPCKVPFRKLFWHHCQEGEEEGEQQLVYMWSQP